MSLTKLVKPTLVTKTNENTLNIPTHLPIPVPQGEVLQIFAEIVNYSLEKRNQLKEIEARKEIYLKELELKHDKEMTELQNNYNERKQYGEVTKRSIEAMIKEREYKQVIECLREWRLLITNKKGGE